MLQLYILLDNILVAMIAAIVGYVGIVLIMYSAIMNSLIITEIVCLSIVFVAFVGNFRVILANCELERYQVIVSKLVLILCCIAFLILGAYFMSADLPDGDT